MKHPFVFFLLCPKKLILENSKKTQYNINIHKILDLFREVLP